MVIDMNKMYIGEFEWKSGSINDNIAKVLDKLSIIIGDYYTTFNGDILTVKDDLHVEAEYNRNTNKYDVCILCK